MKLARKTINEVVLSSNGSDRSPHIVTYSIFTMQQNKSSCLIFIHVGCAPCMILACIVKLIYAPKSIYNEMYYKFIFLYSLIVSVNIFMKFHFAILFTSH